MKHLVTVAIGMWLLTACEAGKPVISQRAACEGLAKSIADLNQTVVAHAEETHDDLIVSIDTLIAEYDAACLVVPKSKPDSWFN